VKKGACRETAPRLQVVAIGLKMQQIVKESDSMKSKFGKAILWGLALALANCVAVSANAATVFVGTCVSPSFSTIQAAVTAVPAGSTVNVCPGTYPEQVTINKRLTLQGIASGTMNQAVVTAPAGGIVQNTVSLATAYPIAAQIYVHDSARVAISNLTVDGSGNNGLTTCGVPNLIGIYYQDATGTIQNVVTRNQTSVPTNGCAQGTGMGIFVQSGISLVTGGAGTSTVTVRNSSVHDFQKNGITGNEVGTTLTVSSNEVRGQGPTNGAAENGVQLGFGATGRVNGNTVIDEIWAPDTSSDSGDAAVGILIFDVADASVVNNHVGNTQFGIAVAGDTTGEADDATITGNTLDGTLIFDGINVCGSSGGTISGNVVSGSTQSGIHLDGTCTGVTSGGTNATANTINEACAGILDGTTGNTISANTFFNTTNTVLDGDVCPAVGENVSRPLIASAAKVRPRPHPARP
jgi:parallel beta-helix repeat protein